MTPYLVVFGWLAFCSVAQNTKQFSYLKPFFFILSSLLLIFFAGFRGAGVGADDWNYIIKFLEVPDISYWFTGEFTYSFSETWMEPAYIALGAIIRLFTSNYTYLFLVVSLFSVGIASYNYYSFSKYVFLVLVLFFVHTYLYRDINQIRAAIAAAIGLFLIPQIYHRQHFKIICTIFLAGAFHMASLSYFLVYFISFLKLTNKRLFVGYVISITLGLLGVSSLLLSVLPNLGHVTTKLTGYANSGYAETVSLLDITNIKNSFILLLSVALRSRIKDKVIYFDTMLLFYFLAVTWRIAFSDFGIFAARVATFFSIVEVLLIPALIYAFRQKFIMTIFILLYAFLTLYLNLYFKEGRFPYEISIV
ncbi:MULTISPECIES: EpsG family protein [unclassified Vibrio]|uniref:EpsG family protein n=1 Tax=unclassified Vibrio TaxID=2614977 RepID=UPI0027BE907D|nr:MULTISPECIES: EpsG family protein [unclassified Vibrio]MDQ2109556.1 EpsG family protein [Vibrio sp. 2017_1457_15]MDQ2162443.1 EpsG family protein [Vibrio sp. 2017_1457_13]